jgi:hypothetical protein
MQLDAPVPDSTIKLEEKLSHAVKLTSCVNLGGSTADQHFSLVMRSHGSLFPLASAVYRKNGISKMSKQAKLDFLSQLKEDVKPLLDEANAQATATKFFRDKSLPVDLEECSGRLDELEALKKRKIEELNAELEVMEEAKFHLERMQANKKEADRFKAAMDRARALDEEPAALPKLKKAKVCD